MLAQNCSFSYDVVIVDYGDPDNLTDWFSTLQNERLYLLRILDRVEWFNLSRARNCGARLACSEVFSFVDADSVLSANWLAQSVEAIQAGAALVRVGSGTDGYAGLCAARAEVFHKVHGYDEALTGWGYEDRDFYRRCQEVGQEKKLPAQLVTPIMHGDEERVCNYQQKETHSNGQRNKRIARARQGHVNPGGYGLAKWEMWRSGTREPILCGVTSPAIPET